MVHVKEARNIDTLGDGHGPDFLDQGLVADGGAGEEPQACDNKQAG